VAKEAQFFNVKYKEGSLDPKTNQLIRFAVCLVLGHEEGALNHLAKARAQGASEDEIWETAAYTMRVPAAKVRYFAKRIIGAK
jgi:AhpD family alkylhydroperoxidase